MTQYLHRLLLIIPAANQAAMNNFWAQQIDTDGAGHLTFTVGLSASGTGVPSHYWTSTALTPAQLRKVMVRLCNLAVISQPANWDTMTRQEHKQWFGQQKPTIRANIGVRVQLSDNDGAWDDPHVERVAEGVQPVESV